ncbi:DUF3825 domain-containing protein [Gelidibacter japonicus]|uniref:DUF3825 domain-containing protein n=1 Tax=Gelidibacter japonicus TaxID=1962232 RepID=UPI003A91B62B
MDKNIVNDTLVSLITELRQDDGWINLATLGLALSQNGINYKELGFYKLGNFIASHSELIETKVDNTHKMPVHFVRLRDKPNPKAKNQSIYQNPKNALTDWAYLKHYQTTINKLAEFALDERWFYKEQDPDFPFPILTSYLHYTFYKLSKENNKILKSDKYSAFNTGLVDNRYEPIYALFEDVDSYTQSRKLVDFCVSGEGFAGKELVRNFKDLPERATYFSTVSDMLYDTKAGEPELDMKHIALDNIGRLPLHFISDNAPRDFALKNPDLLSWDERQNYYLELAKAIENDSKTYRNITNRLKDAAALAIKRVQWNFKSAIPMYFPTQDKMSLLLPLSLMDDEKVDVALVVEKTKSGNYLGHTILPLDWAYTNARLVSRPDSDWLEAANIETNISGTDED